MVPFAFPCASKFSRRFPLVTETEKAKELDLRILLYYCLLACLFVCLFVCQKLLYIFIQRGFSISWESNKDPAIPHNQIEYSTPKHNQWPIFMHELAPLLRSNDQMKHLHPFPLGKICVTNISEEKSLVSVPNSPKFMSNDVLHKPKKKKIMGRASLESTVQEMRYI